jgi:hypothetical protein
MDTLDFDGEPTPSELRAIEAEWPVIAAELAVLDAEIAALQNGPEFCELDRRRLRRAETLLTRTLTTDIQTGTTLDGAA